MAQPTYTRPWLPQFEAIRTDVVDLVIKALGPIRAGPETAPLSQNPLIRRRDSVTYRARALGFHLDLLKAQFDGFSRQANAKIGDERERINLLHDCRHFLTFLLDDVLFNSISLLDYTGNLAGCILLGPDHQRLKWNGIVRAANDSGNRVHSSAVGRVIASLNSEWADRLNEVRSKVIHFGVELGDGKQVLSLQSERFVSTLAFSLPTSVVSRLRFLQTLRKEGQVDLIEGAEAIGLRTMSAASQVILALIDDVGGRLSSTASS